eukprot:5396747-Pyramimonas_sp.AAC.1
MEIDCVDSNVTKKSNTGPWINNAEESPYLHLELLHRFPSLCMAHVKPPTWASAQACRTGQFLEPLCPVAWIWASNPMACHRYIVRVVIQDNPHAASCPSSL